MSDAKCCCNYYCCCCFIAFSAFAVVTGVSISIAVTVVKIEMPQKAVIKVAVADAVTKNCLRM